jgi:hypothetical protein
MSDTTFQGKGWFRQLISGKPHQVIGPPSNPYMLRWYLIPHTRFVNLYLHKFLRSDEDRALHDHPWAFWSWVIKGQYWEYTQGPWLDDETPTFNKWMRKRWSLAYCKATHAHRVELVWGNACREQPVWTIVLTRGKEREWGFWCENGWIPWRQFTDEDGCGE